MIRKIVLKDFLAHKHTEMELGPGVTALTGPNNSGKSAIVEGLRCLATNPVPKSFIRHGAKSARVEVWLDDGTRIAWIRKKASAGYELFRPGCDEPEEYYKFGRTPPQDILDALKLNLVELETGGEIDVHIGNQRSPIFLIDEPPSTAAAFFAASTESAHLLAMQNLLKRKTLDARRESASMSARMTDMEQRLDKLEGLPELTLKAQIAADTEQGLDTLRRELPVLAGNIEKRRSLGSAIESSRRLDAALFPLKTPPDIFDAGKLKGLLGRVVATAKGQEEAKARLKLLEPLKALPELFPAKELLAHVARRNILEKKKKSLVQLNNALSGLHETPTISNLDSLKKTIQDARDLKSAGFRLGELLEGLRTEMDEFQDRYRARLKEIGSCPLCGAELDADGFMERGCGHG